jgi:hypothetical protein
MLCLANPANSVYLIYSLIRATVWANPGSLANPICLPVRVAILANPAQVMLLCLANLVNPVVVTRIFSLVHDFCSNTCHRRVARPNHLVALGQYHMCSL